MKKTIIILATALIAVGCKQENKNASAKEKSNTENATVHNYAGIYTFGDTSKNSTTRNGIIYLYPQTDSAFLFHLFVINGEPSYNSGSIDGRITVQNGKAIFQNRFDFEEKDCIIRFEFKQDTIKVMEDNIDCCGFGHGVYANGIFKRTTSEIPQYYETQTGEKVYFKDWKDTGLTNEKASEDVVCTETETDGGYTQIEKCIYKNKNLKQVYDILKQKQGLDLKEELPKANLKYTIENDSVRLSATYEYKTPNQLRIELAYDGGITGITIIEGKNNTISTITYSAD